MYFACFPASNYAILIPMPEGLSNYLLGGVILSAKVLLVPRTRDLPMFRAYLCASIITSAVFLCGWHAEDPPWTSTVSILGIVAAFECLLFTAGLASLHEQSQIQSFCACIGILLCAGAWIAGPIPYPEYSTLAYSTRLYAGAFTVGWLVALIGYCFTLGIGVRIWLTHSMILLVRVGVMTGVLLVHDRERWYSVSNLSGAVNLATLAGWWWVIPHPASAARGGRSPEFP